MASETLSGWSKAVWPLLVTLVVAAACSSDELLVVRDPNPSLVPYTSPPSTENLKVSVSDEKDEKRAGRLDSDIGSRSGGAATVLLPEDSDPITGWTPWDHVCAWSCRNILDQVLETLTIVLPDGSTSPWLAERVESNPTMLNWTVTIRKGLRFTDGKPVTAHVIKEGYEEFLKRGRVTSGLLRDARINAIIVVDE